MNHEDCHLTRAIVIWAFYYKYLGFAVLFTKKIKATSHTSAMNLTEVARTEYIFDCETLVYTIENRTIEAINDAAANCQRFVEVDISDLEEEFYDIIYEQKCEDIACVADRVLTSNIFEDVTISFEDEHRGVIVFSW